MSDTLPGFEIVIVDQDNPWPGPSSFTEKAAPFFRGRETEAEQLLDLIHENALVVLHAKSGLGKTSLIQAGLFPLLRREDFLPVYVRLRHRDTTEKYAEEIKRDLVKAATEANVTFETPTAEQTLWEYFDPSRAKFLTPRGRSLTPVLIFDQFEELFTLGKDEASNEARYKEVVVELANLIENRMPVSVATRERKKALEEIGRGGRIGAEASFSGERRTCRVVLSLRADFLDVLEHELVKTIPSLARNRYGLLPMTGRRARDAIVEAGGHLMEAGVADRIIITVAAGADQKGSNVDLDELEVEPSLLSIFCRELNLMRRKAHLPKITAKLADGSRETILENFYDRAFELIPIERRDFVQEFVEKKLVLGEGFRDNVALSRVTDELHVHHDDIMKLVEARLLRIEDLGKGRPKAVELTHDVLAAVAFRRLRKRKETEDLAKELDAQKQRQAALKQEAQKEKLRRRRAWLITSGALAVTVFSSYSWYRAWDRGLQMQVAQANLRDEKNVLEAERNELQVSQSSMEHTLSVTADLGLGIMPMLGTHHGQDLMRTIVGSISTFYAKAPPLTDPVALETYADINEEAGSLDEVREDYPRAMDSYLKSLNARVTLGTGSKKATIALGRAYTHVGDVLRLGASVPTFRKELQDLLTPQKAAASGADSQKMDNQGLALAAYKEAVVLFKPLVSESTEADTETRTAYATAYNLLGLELSTSNPTESEKNYETARLELENDPDRTDPGWGDFEYQKARSYSGIAYAENLEGLLGEDGDETRPDSPEKERSSALSNYGQSFGILTKLYQLDNSNGLWAYDWVAVGGSLAGIYESKGELVNKRADGKEPRAEQYYDDAQVGRLHLVAMDGDRSDWQRKLAVGSDHLGDVNNALGELPLAQQYYSDAFNRRRTLMASAPSSEETAFLDPANLAAGPGDTATIDDALEKYPELSVDLESKASGLTDMAVSFSKLGIYNEETDKLKDASSLYGRARYLDGLALQVDGGNFSWRSSYATMTDHVGDILRLRGRYPEALRAYVDAFVKRNGLVAEAAKKGKTPSLQWRVDLATSYDQMGAILVLLSDRASTDEDTDAVNIMTDRVTEADPDAKLAAGSDPAALRALAETCFVHAKDQLGIVLSSPGSKYQRTWKNEFALNDDGFGSVRLREGTAEALKTAASNYSDCIKTEKDLTDNEPKNIKWKHELGINLLHRADVEILENDPDDLKLAGDDLTASEAIMRDLVSTPGQDDGQFLHDLAQVLDSQGDLARKKPDPALAAKLHFECLEDQEKVIAAQEAIGGDWVNVVWMSDMKSTYSDIKEVLADLEKADKAAFDEYNGKLPALYAKMNDLLAKAHTARTEPASPGKEAAGSAGGSQ